MDGIRPTVRTRPRDSAKGGSSAFTELAQQIREGGLLRRRYGYYWTKLIAAPIVVALGLIAFVWIGDTWWQDNHTRHHANPNKLGATTG